MSENLESTLTNVNKFININKNREFYTKHYNQLMKAVFDNLKKQSNFKPLFDRCSLQGSYGDNLKVTMPNEFDLVFILKLPMKELAKIEKDHNNPGNVHIDISKILEKLKKDVNQATKFIILKDWVNLNNLLIVEKIQSWLQSHFQTVLKNMNNEIVVNNTTSKLTYSRQGPAHTVKVNGANGFFYSVDFVPGFEFNESQNVIKGMKGSWLAIPKPLKPPSPKSTSFRSSYFEQESELIRNNNHLKNALRMIKKFRDCHPNMNNLKSYYIKTVFLEKAKKFKDDNSYWKKPIYYIVIDMLHDLEKTLFDERLAFFWNKQCNMYEHFTQNQINEMHCCVISQKYTLSLAKKEMTPELQYKVYAIFLTASERNEINIKRPIVAANQREVKNAQKSGGTTPKFNKENEKPQSNGNPPKKQDPDSNCALN